jgi:hypothetical protein
MPINIARPAKLPIFWNRAACRLAGCCFLGLDLDSKYEGSTFLRNVSKFLSDYMAKIPEDNKITITRISNQHVSSCNNSSFQS